MKAIKFLHKNLTTACPFIHDVRLTALMAGVTSALTEQQVTVTALGRNLKSHSKTKTKHDITYISHEKALFIDLIIRNQGVRVVEFDCLTIYFSDFLSPP